MLTSRDREIVNWIGRQGVARAEHVMIRFSIGRTATYRRLHGLVDYGLVCRHRLLYNDGGLLAATAEGLRWAKLDRLRPARISLALVPHMIASAALAAELEPRLVHETLLTDREHRAAENAAGRPLASALGRAMPWTRPGWCVRCRGSLRSPSSRASLRGSLRSALTDRP